MSVETPNLAELKQAILRSRLKRRIDHHVAEGGEATLPITDRSAPLPLSWAQQRLWFLSQLDPAAGAAYHMPVALRLSGALNREALQATLDRVIARHENLRTSFVGANGTPMQKIAPEDSGFSLIEHDLSALDANAQEQAVAQLGASEARAPFDLATGPLIRGRLLRLAEQEHVLFFTQHHIVSDGWSIGVLIKEVSALYAAFSRGQADPLPPLAIQYADYAAWQRQWLQGKALQSQIDFWRNHLTGAPALLELPADRPRPPMQSYAGDRVDLRLTPELSTTLRQLSQRHGSTLFMTLLAAWSALLSRLSGQTDVVVGSPVANRRRSEVEPLIGFFVNTLALRVAVDMESTVAELLAQVKATTLDAYAHQDVPFEQVVEALQPQRTLSYSPVFQTMLAFNNTPSGGELDLPGLRLSRMGSARHTAHFDLELSLRETGETLEGNVGFTSDLFDRDTVVRLVGYFVTLLQGMVADDTQPIGRLPLLSTSERAQVLTGFNATRTAHQFDRPVQSLFEDQVRRQPDAIAAVFDAQTLTYSELNRRANQLAHRLIALGARPDQRVAMCVERGLDLLIGVLGILKAGAAYVPLDPAYPADRLAYMLDNSAPVALLTQANLRDIGLPKTAVPVLVLDNGALAAEPDHNPQVVGLRPEHLAYVIYTSGSTGQPKGVAMPHAPLLNLINWQCAVADSARGEKVLQFSALGFDVAFQEIFYTLSSGGCLMLLREETRQDPFTLVEFIKTAAVERIFLPFVAFQGLVAAAEREGELLPSLKHVVTAGEQLFVTAAIRSFFARLPQRRLHNHYGPTETHVVTAHTLSDDSANWPVTPPIGRPIWNSQIFILDARLQPVPLGVIGELYIGGAGVARGYLHRDELSAERFLPDPFSDVPAAKMYRTGDLGRWLSNGAIEYLGRNDFQIKIRGFRVELGEIEAKLSACDGVREAVVMAGDDNAGGKRLVAYVLPQDGAEISAPELRAALSLGLAEYMIPSAFVRVTSWPLTPNGKLDRKALPAPDQTAMASREYEAPLGEVEHVVAQVWQQLLGLERAGRNDNFFELGGHSLLAIQLVTRLRQALGAELPLREVFAQPTLQAMARALAAADGVEHTAIAVADRSKALPASWSQQRLWFLDQLDHAAGAAYHMPAALRLIGVLDRAALQATLDRVVARHENLRTSFVGKDGSPIQVIAPQACGFTLLEHDLRALDVDAKEIVVAALVASEARAPFDLAAGPLIRGRVLRLGELEHVLLITQHHIISDGWSLGLLVKEVGALYTAFSQGQPDPLPSLAIQYADYAAWQRQWLQGDVLWAQLDFWRRHLGGAPALLELPTDHPRRPMQSHAGDRVKFCLSPELTAALRNMSQRHGITLFMSLLAGWSILLSRLSGQSDVVVGTPVANRGRAEIEPLLGFFVNTLALRVDVTSNATVAELLSKIKAITVGAYAHQDVPFEQVVEALQPERNLSYSPLFQTMLALDNTPGEGALTLPGLELQPVVTARHTAHFDLELGVVDTGDTLEGNFVFASDLFERRTVERFAGYLLNLLQGMVANDTQSVGRLTLLPALERALLLDGFNSIHASQPQEQLIHILFEQQTDRDPAATALVFEDRTLSYAELNQRANQVAHHLIGLGVQPDDRVGLCVGRSLEMVIGLLGILKAGGAYVPLDPAYPVDRLSYMLEDSAPVAVLTQSVLRDGLPFLASVGKPVVVLDDESLSQLPEINPDAQALGVTPGHLAYVIYTSGSTGQPKGVMVEHRSVINLMHVHVANCRMKAGDRLLQFASYSFDASVEEIFPALSVGATVVLRPANLIAADASFVAFLQEQRIDTVDLPTAFWHQWSQQVAAGLSLPGDTLRLVIVGGEKLEQRYLASWMANPITRACEVLNTYGPTEATVYATSIALDASAALPAREVCIGRPVANTRIYVLDELLQPVPMGVVGEIHIGGTQVARGYLDRPELTAERFVADPFSKTPKARMYKTGDLGRWLSDGTIEYLGRNDFQVKIRGFRIELGEIEAKLSACAGVREAIVIAREDNEGDKRLVAYVVADQDVELSTADLRSALALVLAEHMVPSAFVRLAALPLTPNGKLDHKALPAPDQSAVVSRAYQAPDGPIESVVADIWLRLLGLQKIGRNDHFFELGGHSLLAIKLIHEVKAHLGVTLPLAAVFSSPTIAALAALAEAGPQHKSLIVPLQSTGQGRPLFCIHPIGGQVSFYQSLARQFAGRYPVYGVQSPEVIGLSLRLDSVEAMAAAYAAAIQATQAVGPYRLLGWSSGGLIAAAIARHLIDRGFEVEYLGLVDSHLMSAFADMSDDMLMLEALRSEMHSRGLVAGNRSQVPPGLEQLSISDLLAMDFARVAAYAQSWGWADFSRETFEHLQQQVPVTRHHLRLLSRFRPVLVAAPLQVFWSGEPVDEETIGPSDYGQTAVVAEPRAGATHWVGADHYAMLAEPHVRRVAGAIATFLNEQHWAPTTSTSFRAIAKPLAEALA